MVELAKIMEMVLDVVKRHSSHSSEIFWRDVGDLGAMLFGETWAILEKNVRKKNQEITVHCAAWIAGEVRQMWQVHVFPFPFMFFFFFRGRFEAEERERVRDALDKNNISKVLLKNPVSAQGEVVFWAVHNGIHS